MGEQFKILEYSLIILFISIGRVFLISSSDIIADTIYKTEGSSNDHEDKGGTGNYPKVYREESPETEKEHMEEESPETEKEHVEEESFEIEDEIDHVDDLIEHNKCARDFNALRTSPHTWVNKDFNVVREDNYAKGLLHKTPEIKDLPTLEEKLEEKRKALQIELRDATNCHRSEQRANNKEKGEYNDSANNDSSNNSLTENTEQRRQVRPHPSGWNPINRAYIMPFFSLNVCSYFKSMLVYLRPLLLGNICLLLAGLAIEYIFFIQLDIGLFITESMWWTFSLIVSIIYFPIKLVLMVRKAKKSAALYDRLFNFLANHYSSVIAYPFIILLSIVLVYLSI